MMNDKISFGIDAISFYTPSFYFDFLEKEERIRCSIAAPDEDVISLAANSAKNIVNETNRHKIKAIFFATESAIDESKSAASFLKTILNISDDCRIIEVKQACYGGTFALKAAMAFLKSWYWENGDTESQILVLASDVAHYALETKAQSSQGAASVAMLVSANPHILKIENKETYFNQETYDFWRPNFLATPLVDGKLSCQVYLNLLTKTFSEFQKKYQLKKDDFAAICYHTPLLRLVKIANKRNFPEKQNLLTQVLKYNAEIGNSYTASLFVSIISFLENSDENLTGQRLGFYSYGSGAMAEFFSGIVVSGYQTHLLKNYHQTLLANRQLLDEKTYLAFYNAYEKREANLEISKYVKNGFYRLKEIRENKRIYE